MAKPKSEYNRGYETAITKGSLDLFIMMRPLVALFDKLSEEDKEGDEDEKEEIARKALLESVELSGNIAKYFIEEHRKMKEKEEDANTSKDSPFK